LDLELGIELGTEVGSVLRSAGVVSSEMGGVVCGDISTGISHRD